MKIAENILANINAMISQLEIDALPLDMNSPINNRIIDSIDFVHLISLIEKEYNIRFELAEIKTIATAKDLVFEILKKQYKN